MAEPAQWNHLAAKLRIVKKGGGVKSSIATACRFRIGRLRKFFAWLDALSFSDFADQRTIDGGAW